jgi:hypothetical protein
LSTLVTTAKLKLKQDGIVKYVMILISAYPAKKSKVILIKWKNLDLILMMDPVLPRTLKNLAVNLFNAVFNLLFMPANAVMLIAA